MKQVCDIEKSYLSVLVTEQAFQYASIKGEYFLNKDYGRIYDLLMECYRTYGFIKEDFIINSDFMELKLTYPELLMRQEEEQYQFYVPCKNYEGLIQAYEKQIQDRYKVVIKEKLDQKLHDNEITYSKYVEKLNELNDIYVSGTKAKPILSISEIEDTEEESVKILSNINGLDKKIGGFALGELSVWSGSNGGAKSTILNQIAIESINQGFNTLIYSGELTATRLINWITNQCAGRHNMKFNNESMKWYTPIKSREKITKWLDGKLFIYNNVSGNKAEDIMKNMRNYIVNHNVKMIIMDNLMSMDSTGYDSEVYKAQSSIAKELSLIAHEFNVHIHFVCHPRKATSFLRKNDISGSADLTNAADNVFIAHRINEDFKKTASEFYSPEVVEKLCKYTNIIEICKHRESGMQDAFAGMYYDEVSKRLLDVPNENRKYGWENG